MLPPNLTIIDAIAVILIAIGAVQGLLRGLSGEMARLLGALCAFVAGALLHEPLGEGVAAYTRLSDQQARMLTYVFTVLAALLLWTLFHKLFRKLIRLALSAGFDKAAGIPAGMLRMTALVGIVFIAMNIWPNAPGKAHFGEISFFGRHAIRLVPAVQREMEARNFTLREQTDEYPIHAQHEGEERAP